MSGQTKIVVFTGDLAYSVRKGIVEIDRALDHVSWLILLHAPQKPPAQLVRNQWRNLRRNGWRWIPYLLNDVRQRLSDKPPSRFPEKAFPGYEYLGDIAQRPNLRVVRVSDIHAQPALDCVAEFAPDLGLSLAAPILKRALFALPRLGTLNLHKGRVPDYRGMPPAFWELWNDDNAVGCTVHRVDDRLDTGEIVAQTAIPRAKFSTVRGLQLQLDEVGVQLMRDAAIDVLNGTARPAPQPAGGKTYRKPTLAQVAALDRKLVRQTPVSTPLFKQVIKQSYARAGWRAWRLGLGRLATPRITVLLYHRVSDEVRDNLTVGVAQFDRQMSLLRKHCEVMSITDVVAMQVVPRSERPLVAVTFDDGYQDNYANAAPILVRNNVPAAFFVSTGIVSRNGRFPHDLRRGNPPIPLMTWDQLRQMRDWGFTIGSHSVNHIDCAAEPEDTVRAELAQSRDDLRRELGITDLIFAYPYGGKQNMTPQRLELVKQAGYSACLSAYGGANISTVDRYNVLRRGIHWQYSDEALLFASLGLT